MLWVKSMKEKFKVYRERYLEAKGKVRDEY